MMEVEHPQLSVNKNIGNIMALLGCTLSLVTSWIIQILYFLFPLQPAEVWPVSCTVTEHHFGNHGKLAKMD